MICRDVHYVGYSWDSVSAHYRGMRVLYNDRHYKIDTIVMLFRLPTCSVDRERHGFNRIGRIVTLQRYSQ